MKPVFGIDVTYDKKNEEINGEEFVVATTSSVLTRSHERSGEDAQKQLAQAQLPVFFRILKWIGGVVGGVGMIGLVRGLANVGLAQAYQNAGWLFWLIGTSLVAWLGLTLIERKRSQTVLESDEAHKVLSSLQETSEKIYRELGVPETAVNMDIFVFHYKVKNGAIKAVVKGISTEFTNADAKVYVQEGKLYIADLSNAYAFSLSAMRGIRTIFKRVGIPRWNKEVAYNEGIYKSYKIIFQNNMGWYMVKPYHILEFEVNGQMWGIYFPCYELPVMEKLTGQQADAT